MIIDKRIITVPPASAEDFIFSRLDARILQLKYQAINYFMIGLAVGIVMGTMVWFSVYASINQGDITVISFDGGKNEDNIYTKEVFREKH